MLLEMVGLSKSLATDLAGKRTLPRVASHVFLQIAGLRERTEAHDARVPALARVDHHVTAHRRVETERLGADIALVRTFSGVTSSVVTHLIQAREMSSAVLTREWTFACSTVRALQQKCFNKKNSH